MKIAYYIKKIALEKDPAIEALFARLRKAGMEIYPVNRGLSSGTEMLLCFGGDGTFLSAAGAVCRSGVPVLGVNLGRLGFLSENELSEVEKALLEGNYHIEERTMLQVKTGQAPEENFFPYALNEVAVRRSASGTLELQAGIDGENLPSFWGDGLLVSTASGSTAYSLSVGGPVCRPDVPAFILAPIAPHNLNVRPLLVPESVKISIKGVDRKNAPLLLSLDNRDYNLPCGSEIEVSCAPFKLRRVVLGKSNFIQALRTKLLWGEDVRNTQ